MATILELCELGTIIRIGGGLDVDEQPMRLLYAFPHVVEWLDTKLPELEPILDEGRQSPAEQLDLLFYDFISGEDLGYYQRSHSMNPREPGIWELKTPDIRIFGWFSSRCCFVMAEIDTAFRCKEHNLYAGYRDSAVRRRESLDLNEPKFVTGDYIDVL